MAHSSQFTHGGSVGKNLGLAFRALLNILSFGALWFGLIQWATDTVLFELPEKVPVMCIAVGGGLTLLLLFVNLFLPMAHRAKR